jgi:hypothetical protein
MTWFANTIMLGNKSSIKLRSGAVIYLQPPSYIGDLLILAFYEPGLVASLQVRGSKRSTKKYKQRPYWFHGALKGDPSVASREERVSRLYTMSGATKSPFTAFKRPLYVQTSYFNSAPTNIKNKPTKEQHTDARARRATSAQKSTNKCTTKQ